MTAQNVHVQEPSTPTRNSSMYTLDIAVEPGSKLEGHICDAMRERADELGVTVFASGVDRGRAFLRFRVKDDELAAAVAVQLRDIEDGRTLHTGYGAHRREVLS